MTEVGFPNEEGRFQKLASTLYNSLIENRVYQDKSFNLSSLASMDFSKIMDTVISDKRMFGQMKNTLVDHVRTSLLPNAKPYLKLISGQVSNFIFGPSWGSLLSSTMSGFIDQSVELFSKDATISEYMPGDWFAIDIIKTKGSESSLKEQKSYTLGFYVDNDTRSNKLFLFIYEEGKVMTVDRKFCRKLQDTESSSFDKNDQLQFVKEIFLLRYYHPSSLTSEHRNLKQGSEVKYKGATHYVIHQSGKRVLIEDKVGNRVETNLSQISTLRSNSLDDLNRGDWVFIPSELDSRFPKVLSVVNCFFNNDCIAYESTTGKSRRVNKHDVEKVTSAYLRTFGNHVLFTKFRMAAMKGRNDTHTKRIPKKFYHICFGQGTDIKISTPGQKFQPKKTSELPQEDEEFQMDTEIFEGPVAYEEKKEYKQVENNNAPMVIGVIAVLLLLSVNI
jgi:hypothetical protein